MLTPRRSAGYDHRSTLKRFTTALPRGANRLLYISSKKSLRYHSVAWSPSNGKRMSSEKLATR